MSLFQNKTESKEDVIAICCEDGRKELASGLEDWMLEIVPRGEYRIEIGGHTLILSMARYGECEIEPSHRYYHYTINGNVYAGVFIG